MLALLSRDPHPVHGSTMYLAFVLCMASLCGDPHPVHGGSACALRKLGSFCNGAVAVVYFSPRLLCRFDLEAKASSIRRRMAWGRVNETS